MASEACWPGLAGDLLLNLVIKYFSSRLQICSRWRLEWRLLGDIICLIFTQNSWTWLISVSKILAAVCVIVNNFAVTPYHPEWNLFCAVDLDRFELDAPIEDLHLVSSRQPSQQLSLLSLLATVGWSCLDMSGEIQ